MTPSSREKRPQTLPHTKSITMGHKDFGKRFSAQGAEFAEKRGNNMRARTRFETLVVAVAFAAVGAVRAQEMQMSPQEQHHQMNIPVVKPQYPRMGRAQENAKGVLFTLEQAQKIASESNPTLRQAELEIRAAKARQQQSGLYPNPTVAYTGDEIRGGSVGGDGEDCEVAVGTHVGWALPITIRGGGQCPPYLD